MREIMSDRRHFLAAAGAAAFALPAWAAPDEPDTIPDGSDSRDLITPETQRAVEAGLAYLVRSQDAAGAFGERQYSGNVAVTSLGALALMAGGHQPGRGEYGAAVTKAVEFVLSKENREPPGFLHNPLGAPHGPMYSHGFGTLFLGEVYGMLPDRELQKRVRGTLERAVQVIVRSQNREGGWRYQPVPSQADVSVTICQIMALRSARNAGLFVPKSTVEACVKYVQACQVPDGGFSYFKGIGSSAFARSAAGVVALYCAGVYKGPAIERGLEYLRRYRPNLPLARRGDVPEIHYYYGQYYAAQAMWTAGRQHWAEWFPAVRDELLARARGRPDGSWGDSTTCSAYATAMACIILQIPNNYLPILQK
jgi:hypothetical protein